MCVLEVGRNMLYCWATSLVYDIAACVFSPHVILILLLRSIYMTDINSHIGAV